MASDGGGFLSESKAEGERRSWLPWLVAGSAILVVLAFFFFSGRRQQSQEQAQSADQRPDAYASKIAIGNIDMSEATNFAGSKVTYIDGQVTNNGDKTVTGINVTVTFKNSVGEPPQVVPMTLSLIRTKEPYVDIEPVSADPLKPGASHEFRLIFDHVTPNWDIHHPDIVPTRITTQ